jgi:hypothetical protein
VLGVGLGCTHFGSTGSSPSTVDGRRRRSSPAADADLRDRADSDNTASTASSVVVNRPHQIDTLALPCTTSGADTRATATHAVGMGCTARDDPARDGRPPRGVRRAPVHRRRDANAVCGVGATIALKPHG